MESITLLQLHPQSKIRGNGTILERLVSYFGVPFVHISGCRMQCLPISSSNSFLVVAKIIIAMLFAVIPMLYVFIQLDIDGSFCFQVWNLVAEIVILG